jgi:hypothetical protein
MFTNTIANLIAFWTQLHDSFVRNWTYTKESFLELLLWCVLVFFSAACWTFGCRFAGWLLGS